MIKDNALDFGLSSYHHPCQNLEQLNFSVSPLEMPSTMYCKGKNRCERHCITTDFSSSSHLQLASHKAYAVVCVNLGWVDNEFWLQYRRRFIIYNCWIGITVMLQKNLAVGYEKISGPQSINAVYSLLRFTLCYYYDHPAKKSFPWMEPCLFCSSIKSTQCGRCPLP